MGRYIHKFSTAAEFRAAYEGTAYTEPWVSLTEETSEVNYNKYDPSNGHAYVDLGLPSGTLWATMNVGATSETDYGGYFAWGETVDKFGNGETAYTWDNYECGSAYNRLTKYCPEDKSSQWNGEGSPDNLTELEASDDAASVNWGGEWHMPTSGQCEELINNTVSAWTSDYNDSGVAGVVFTAQNGNSLFIPAAGHVWDEGRGGVGSWFGVWTSSLLTGYPDDAWGLGGGNEGVRVYNNYRCYGYSVRGVLGELSTNT